MSDRNNWDGAVNPYHYVRHCIGGKWKMTILHEIYTFGRIRFYQTLKQIPVTEKVLAQQLRELTEDGLIEKIDYDTVPPKVEYTLSERGKSLMAVLDQSNAIYLVDYNANSRIFSFSAQISAD